MLKVEWKKLNSTFAFLPLLLHLCALPYLSGKVFTFPRETDTAHVRLNPIKQDYNAVTVCHRSFTDLKRDHTFFSLATPFDTNAFLILWQNQEIDPHIWFDGLPSIRRFIISGSITRTNNKPLFLILHHFGYPTGPRHPWGGFDINQSFVGMITDVHMWDYTLSSCEIRHYTEEMHFTSGNVLNWSTIKIYLYCSILGPDLYLVPL
uniref:Pentraxin (PTX) domain-containing protein n=1 Tax=Oryzias sinensis TaxID=183150 RepID=A0A8C8DLH6_9TELE